ncbi:MAG: hypothetical protein QM736_06705 [Vicinamibacterales bacterium]
MYPKLVAADVSGADAIVVLGAGVVSHSLNGYSASVPDSQTVFNAFEGRTCLPICCRPPCRSWRSGGVVNSDWQREPESAIIRDLLVRAGVPADVITLESSSKTSSLTRSNVAPMI